jgi:hypothetical protein
MRARAVRPADLVRMVKIAKDASARIEQVGFLNSDYRQELQDRLDGERPGSVLALQAIVDAVTGAQADAKRRQEQEEAADVYEAVVGQLTKEQAEKARDGRGGAQQPSLLRL